MAITQEDIVYTFSGGEENNNPLLSLGGGRSSFPVVGTTIFSDINEEDAATGYTDYRCVYVSNYNETSTLYDAKIYFESQVANGATMNLGFLFLDERQDLRITNYSTISSGNFDINYTYVNNSGDVTTATFTITYDSNFTNLANSIKSALNTVPNLEDITITVFNIPSIQEVSFQIEFKGAAGKRYHDLITLTNISLFGLSGTITVSRVVAGSPINRLAGEVENTLVNPVDITFQNYISTFSAAVGDLRPLDFCAIWIRRVTPAGVSPIEGDGGVLRVYGGIV